MDKKTGPSPEKKKPEEKAQERDLKRSAFGYFFIVLAGVGAGILFFLADQDSTLPIKEASVSQSSAVPGYEKINHEMKKVQSELEYNQFKKEVEARQVLLDAQKANREEAYKYPDHLQAVGNEEKPVEYQDPYKDPDYASPKNKILQEMYQQQIAEQQDEVYKAEYARQFVENARRGGYQVVLTPDYKVISVTPIKPRGGKGPASTGEDSFDLFQNGATR